MVKGGVFEGIHLEKEDNVVKVSFASKRLSKSSKKIKYSWTWNDREKSDEILVQSGDVGIISTDEWCNLHSNFVKTNLLFLQVNHSNTFTPFTFGPFFSHPLLSKFSWEHQKTDSEDMIQLNYQIKDIGGKLITKQHTLAINFDSEKRDLTNKINNLVDVLYAENIEVKNLEVPFYTKNWKKTFILKFWRTNSFGYNIQITINSDLNVKQICDITATKLSDNTHKLSTDMIRIDTNKQFGHSWNIRSKFKTFKLLTTYIDEFNQKDHPFILFQPSANQKIPVEIASLSDDKKEKFTQRYLRVEWENKSDNDDRLFPKLVYDLSMNVIPRGKIRLLPAKSDGKIFGYKIEQKYSSLISEIKDGDLVCSIKSKFKDLKSAERYVEAFNEEWDHFFLGEPNSLMLRVTVDCLSDEEWIRKNNFNLKNHLVYFKLNFQKSYSMFCNPKLEFFYERPRASITKFAIGPTKRNFCVQYSFSNNFVISISNFPPVYQIDERESKVKSVKESNISHWWEPKDFQKIQLQYNNEQRWADTGSLPDFACWLKEIIKSMGLVIDDKKPYYGILRDCRVQVPKSRLKGMYDESILIPIDHCLQESDKGRRLSKKYWFTLDPITLRVFTRSKQYYHKDEQWSQPEYAYSENKEQEFSRIHYHFAEDEPYEFKNGDKTLETKDSSEQEDGIRMYLLQEWMGVL